MVVVDLPTRSDRYGRDSGRELNSHRHIAACSAAVPQLTGAVVPPGVDVTVRPKYKAVELTRSDWAPPPMMMMLINQDGTVLSSH
jgi:hypothetical protein